MKQVNDWQDITIGGGGIQIKILTRAIGSWLFLPLIINVQFQTRKLRRPQKDVNEWLWKAKKKREKP